MAKRYGLIGFPLEHSFSPSYFKEKFSSENISDAEYKLFPLSNISELKDLIQNETTLLGLNVTIPYKESVIPYLDELSEEAKQIGAVNCIKIIRKENEIESGRKIKLVGYNSDVYGFEKSLLPFLRSNLKALVLGSGGSSKAVIFVLKKLQIPSLLVSRSVTENALSYEQLDEEIMSSHRLIINTTPLGLFPNTENCPDIPYQHLNEQNILYDLIYNPEETEFMRRGKQKGAMAIGGLKMLQLQADKSWEIWNSNK